MPHSSSEPNPTRTRSAEVASVALKAVRSSREQLVAGGMSQTKFAVGVCNALATAFVIGRWPEHYFILMILKSLIILPAITVKYSLSRKQLYLLDFCWATNFLVCSLSVCILFILFSPAPPFSDVHLEQGWLLFFMLGTGPLGWSVVATGNALIFHSIDHMGVLFIHVAPMLAAWCVRWHGPAFHAAYPGLTAATPHANHDVWSLVLPATVFYGAWWLPYTIWLLVDGIHQPARGNKTVFTSFQPMVQKYSGVTSTAGCAAVYMAGHAIAVNCTFFVAILAYRVYWLHTAFGVAMLLVAVSNGASRYNHYLLNVYQKRLADALEQDRVRGDEMTRLI
jgi:hypothetical protein